MFHSGWGDSVPSGLKGGLADDSGGFRGNPFKTHVKSYFA